ncbi:aminodeoxychorismate synthase component I [Azohydromonas caseinilytica]|uniref:Aminodeoxychorismate synthase component I n=1 Tax=Azohydromonas caseinilytica TaxID=2728836 RepID=A0A848FF92_9BURK|nr:aminodeoxychorismate synthase component I [Azohydromonas caseinilytica]NML17952.1 aminodeoxychorismate synthase component I [Azohydromonas caseinilytica]
MVHAPFALLDDCGATPERPSSRLYRGFVREHRCTDPATLDTVMAAAESDMAAGLHAVVLADYEWGVKLQRPSQADTDRNQGASLRLLMFSELAFLSRAQADQWLADAVGAESAGHAGVASWRESLGGAEFERAIGAIHQAIREGQTYQVNFTYRMFGQAVGTPAAIYQRLRSRQPVSYGAFLALPAGGDIEFVLSCSPELFLRHAAGVLTACPMKGTAPRCSNADEDREMARWLARDVKNRAENLMIVDLLRNDMGRIAVPGTVRVPALFSVESHASVFQMTSTVQAALRSEISFADVLRATFPCGSITGAPKLQTMKLISELESTPRGLYTGSIGWLDRPHEGRHCGDFCLSVAIRTMTLGPEANGLRAASLGVGAGIVLDSEADAELAECRLKARFAAALSPCLESSGANVAGLADRSWPAELAQECKASCAEDETFRQARMFSG